MTTVLGVQATLATLPVTQRKVLQGEFVADGRRARAAKDDLGLTWRQWRDALDEALRAFERAWQARVASAGVRA